LNFFLLIFDQNVEQKRPAGAYPLRDFHKICRVCTPFQDALGVKIWLDLLEGLWNYGGLKFRGSGYPQIFNAPSGETMRHTPKSFRGARTCSRSSITMPSLVGLGFHSPPGQPKTLSFLSVCLSVTLLNVRDLCARFRHESVAVQKQFLMPLDRGRFVVGHPCSTLSDCCQLATTLNAEVQKTAKTGGFRQQRVTE